MKIVETVTYDDFQSFYVDVLPNGDQGHQHMDIYRGNSSASYGLLPSLLRPKGGKKYTIEFEAVKNEHAQLRRFYNEANRRGLPLPTSDITRNLLFIEPLSYAASIPGWYPDRAFEELAALAQHYGVETRMLDWSFSFYTALYFAAVNTCKGMENGTYKKDDHMAVWRLRLSLYTDELKETPFRTIVPSYSGNPNLQAQQGVLAYMKVKDIEDPINDTPFEDFFNSLGLSPQIHPLLTQYRIPSREARKCLWFLLQLGYSGAYFFPGYAGVTKYIEEVKFSTPSIFSPWKVGLLL